MKLVRYNKNERGFTLFEYCAGAAVILGVVWAAMSAVGTSMDKLIRSIATWADARRGNIESPGSSDSK